MAPSTANRNMITRTAYRRERRTAPRGRGWERDDARPMGRASWRSSRVHPPGAGTTKQASAGALGDQELALHLVQPAPDAVRLTNSQCVVETIPANHA